jgi:hypothetical protein
MWTDSKRTYCYQSSHRIVHGSLSLVVFFSYQQQSRRTPTALLRSMSTSSNESGLDGTVAAKHFARNIEFLSTPINVPGDISFESEWNSLKNLVGPLAVPYRCAGHEHFRPVLSGAHACETDFNKKLFDAFFNALGGDLRMERVTGWDEKAVALRGTKVGFAREFQRFPRLGLKKVWDGVYTIRPSVCCVSRARWG